MPAIETRNHSDRPRSAIGGRLKAQRANAKRIARADLVIGNNGTPDTMLARPLAAGQRLTIPRADALKLATLLRFHKALIDRKYRLPFFS